MKKSRILVIDDDIHATRIVELTLERTGLYEVRGLNDPAESLTIAREFKPDLVLLDVNMPGVGGGDVAFMIRSDKEFERTPIVFLTSLVSEREGKSKGVLVGGFHFVAKPPRLDRMVDCIERNLDIAEAGNEHQQKGTTHEQKTHSGY
jgi:two-component system alkaline phosphatase synthesis response regulator PhoP